MDKFIINGRKPLSGTISVNGSKNCAVKILAASLLCKKGSFFLKNMPFIEDINRMIELIENLGFYIRRDGRRTVRIKAAAEIKSEIDSQIARKFRASIMATGPILARTGKVSFPHPGGCVIGKRPIDLFLDGFRAFGAKVEIKGNEKNLAYEIRARKLRPTDYTFKIISVTGTECMMAMASLIRGKTILRNAACEPEVVVLADFLNKCGAKIQGAGTHTIIIRGVNSLKGRDYKIMPDRIEAGSFAILGALSKKLRIENIIPEHLSNPILILQSMGVVIKKGKSSIEILAPKRLKSVDIKTHEYPGFPTDLQAPYAVLATQAHGETMIHETIYDGRLSYVEDLNRMGADITICDPHRVIIKGATRLYGSSMKSPDLRAGLTYILAAMIANGTSEIENIYQVDRGYEKIENRLGKLGADIRRIKANNA